MIIIVKSSAKAKITRRNTMGDAELYSNYIRREPHDKSQKFVSNWHRKLLNHCLKESSNPTNNVLEVGPGHGYFASHVVEKGMNYEFVDTSPAVYDKMTSQGFIGHLGTVGIIQSSPKRFDLIWLSHVLEHSPTWVEARQLVSDVANLLSPTGRIVIVGPDAQCFRREFWNIDATHGFPTTLRNVAQLADDVGLSVINADHHRNASFGVMSKALFCILSFLPHQFIDRVFTPKRWKTGQGYLISWKTIFGWRQIYLSLESRRKIPT